MALQNISRKNNGNYNNNEFLVTIRDFKESHIQFRKRTDRKRCDHKFSSEEEK